MIPERIDLLGQVIRDRIEKVYGRIQPTRTVDAVLVYNRDSLDRNFLYMTGLDTGVFENCGLVFERNGRMYIFATTLEEEILKSIEEYAKIMVYKDKQERNDTLKKILSKYKTIGISFDSASHSLYLQLKELLDDVEFVDIGNAFKAARMIKSEDEIEKIKATLADLTIEKYHICDVYTQRPSVERWMGGSL
mgnify:CR=1 FL=1